jgi:NAD(P)-dependent dehydrogenase (short-subunit alcohol dehydrogenase family)
VVKVTSMTAQHRPVAAGRVGNPAYASTKAGLDRVGNLLASELLPERVAVVSVDPGLVLSATDEAMTEAGSPLPKGHVTTDIPARAIAAITALHDPMLLSGEVVDAQELLRRLG